MQWLLIVPADDRQVARGSDGSGATARGVIAPGAADTKGRTSTIDAAAVPAAATAAVSVAALHPA